MHQLVHAVVGMVGDTLREKHITLELALDARQHFVEADQARMQQVLWNIVRNALKFTPAGGRVVLRSDSRAGDFHLACKDSGIGIASEALARIFSPFEQADTEVARHFGGLGLGLAIAQGLMVQHRGRIRAGSDGPGHGATFSITLPLAASEDAQATPDAAPEAAQSQRKRVLLVEDNHDAATVLALCLEEYGYVVEHVATCADALRVAGSGGFDAVLTDLGLPDGSGIDVGRALSPRLPVVALSGYGRDHDRQRSSEAGFAAHLVKPADPAQVHACLSGLLTRQPGTQATGA
jgi:CheY-like chemotaxis protein